MEFPKTVRFMRDASGEIDAVTLEFDDGRIAMYDRTLEFKMPKPQTGVTDIEFTVGYEHKEEDR